MVHWGFLNTWQANGLNTQVLGTLREVLTTSLPPPAGRPWRLLFTGHSLGGALASLAAHDAVALGASLAAALPGGAPQVRVYTFGAPRPGNHAFARDYLATVPHSFDVIHCDDAVTRGGKFLFLYKRAAHRVVLSPTGDLIVRPSLIERSAKESFHTSLQQHLLGEYGRSFAALIRGQFVRRKEHNQGRRGCEALLQCEYVQQVLRAMAGVRQESILRFGGRMATLPPGRRGDQHLASGEQLPARPPAHDSARALSLGERSEKETRRLQHAVTFVTHFLAELTDSSLLGVDVTGRDVVRVAAMPKTAIYQAEGLAFIRRRKKGCLLSWGSETVVLIWKKALPDGTTVWSGPIFLKGKTWGVGFTLGFLDMRICLAILNTKGMGAVLRPHHSATVSASFMVDMNGSKIRALRTSSADEVSQVTTDAHGGMQAKYYLLEACIVDLSANEAVAAVAAARAARGGSLEKGSADGGSGPVPAWAASEDGSAAGSAGGRPQLAPMRLGSPPR
ncbi:hypothetical protein CHLNCDRAFT_144281 [Chlorella variabilis]|uniref:Fungal lipase-type domain-containing protein n=1 Tax=Chlorella variabilis TaxID=554065 RepID=E1ZCC2_CHLVA|nr:hypothetical protein CHLNCDRAFT_144281 [Chlorella variabilis]EFN56581.1 hypothetical protein CHLNCDRAFT_144281 [Chlorella variabilis]|eukprot:XP_005848683.1 hypothetical protein CHLNCDRAFT_144281 [Chlorella variabilis]